MNTKQNNGYTYDFTNNTLTITAAFAKKASQIGTKEYRIVKQFRMDCPNLTIEKRTNKGEHSCAGIKYEAMETYIGKCRNAKQYIGLFNTVRELSKGQPSPYRYVCDWFTVNFINYAEPVLDAEGFVVDGAKLDGLWKSLTLTAPVQTIAA